MVGSGGLVAMNQGTCMVSIARFFMEFTQRESCGKCVLVPGRNQATAGAAGRRD
jgi:NADH:ubiquinone oxidoreductase subunit F (NADH-binding)